MLITKSNKKHKRQYVYGGSGVFDTIASILTSNAAKEIGTSVAKTAGTKLAEKGVERVFRSKKHKLNAHAQALLKKMLAPPIQDYVKR